MGDKMEEVATAFAPAALGAYSQAVKANGFVFVSGQLGIDPVTGELAGDTAADQAAQALKNIKNILDAAGSGIEVFIGSVKPARCAFGGNNIPKGALVEIDAIAVC